MKSHLIAAAAVTGSIVAAPCVVAGVVDFNADTPDYYANPYQFANGFITPISFFARGGMAGRGIGDPYFILPATDLFGSTPPPGGLSGNVMLGSQEGYLGVLFDHSVSSLSLDYAFDYQLPQRAAAFGAVAYVYGPGASDLGDYSAIVTDVADGPIFPGDDGLLEPDSPFFFGNIEIGDVGPIGAVLFAFGILDPDRPLGTGADLGRGKSLADVFLADNLIYNEVIPLPSGAAMGLAGLGLAFARRLRQS